MTMRLASARRSRAQRLAEVGTDPDPRFTLANERTFLAWIRTSLALMAAAVAVSQLIPASNLRGSRPVLALALAAVGLLISATAYLRWVGNERAMRTGEPLPHTPLLQIVSYGLTAIGVVVIVVVIVA